MVWGCMCAAGSEQLSLIEGTMNANMYCDILKQSMIPSLWRLGRRAVFQHDSDHCLAKEAEGKGGGLAKHVSRPKPYWASVGHPQTEGRWRSARSLTSTSSVMLSGRGLQWQKKNSRNKALKYFTLCVMNLYNMSFTFWNEWQWHHDILFFFWCTCMYVYIYIYIYVCMYVCMYVCVYIYIYIYTHTYRL